MENDEINIREIISLFWEKRVIIYVAIAIAVVVGFIYTMYFKTPKYTASVTLILVQKNSNSENTAITQTDVSLNDKLIATYKELAKSNAVVREVINNLSISNITENQLKSEINVTAVKETQILQISVTDADPAKAQKVANELSKVFCSKVTEIYKMDNVSIVDQAELPDPDKPSNINHEKDLIIAVAIAVVGAIGLILLINMLDTTVKSGNDIEKIKDLIILAEIPECNFEGKKLF